MKKFVSFRIIAFAFIAGFITLVTCADASVSFLGVAAGDATTGDVTVWTRAKDEVSPGPVQLNVQITTDPNFITGVNTLPAGTADAPTDYTVKTNIAGLQSATTYYYRFQTLNGGAAAGAGVGSTTGMPPFDFLTGAGVDARVSTNDVTPNDGSVPFMNKSGGFQRLQQVFENYQPLTERGVITVPADPRTNGTRQLYFAQRWGRNAIFINTDCRSYRDIRMKFAGDQRRRQVVDGRLLRGTQRVAEIHRR
jgi:hypothetical protein